MIDLFIWLVMGHALCDFALQSDAMARGKNPLTPTPVKFGVPWYYWLGAHALIHGGCVAFLTGSMCLGIAETVWHFVIDRAKSEGVTNIHWDQALHILCKAVWVAAIVLEAIYF